MHIEYNLNEADVLAFQLYFYEHSPQVVRGRKLLRLLMILSLSLGALSVAMYLYFFGTEALWYVIFMGVIIILGVLYLSLYPLLRKRIVGAGVKRVLYCTPLRKAVD
jgi:uncharacterized membrane protein YoaK (UPF0700 family)